MPSSIHTILELLSITGIGAARYWKLIEAFETPEKIVSADQTLLRNIVAPQLAAKIGEIGENGAKYAANILGWCENNGIHIISHLDRRYPSLLKEIYRGPPLLYVKGAPECLDQPQIAIVGSRNSSQAGKKNAFAFSAELAAAGICITSGLALGIDTQAHLGALSTAGKTLAVVGTGVEKIYPAKNRYLYDRIIAENGAIVSEFPLNTPPSAENFPRRNRIISGLSYGTLVIEAAIRSGSLITARNAMEQNREVFAIPGSIHSPLSRGCHALIKQGANLVDCAVDIVEHLGGFASANLGTKTEVPEKDIDSLSVQEREVLKHVEYEPLSIEFIAEKSKLALGDILSVLMSLELKGIICQNSLGFARI